MTKMCDNTSVAALVHDDKRRLLLIERKKYNPGWALVAGHGDGADSALAIVKELEEEVGLKAEEVALVLEKTLSNPCFRAKGIFHRWSVFEVKSWSGEISPSSLEVKNYMWATLDDVQMLASRLENFLRKHGVSLDIMHEVVRLTNEDPQWAENPGLEPPMYILLKELKML